MPLYIRVKAQLIAYMICAKERTMFQMELENLQSNDLYTLLLESYKTSMQYASTETARWHEQRGNAILNVLKNSISKCKIQTQAYKRFVEKQRFEVKMYLANASKESVFFGYIELYLETLDFLENTTDTI